MNKLLQTTLTLTNIVLYLVMIALWISIPDEFWLNFFLSAFNFSLSLLLAFLTRKELALYVKSSVFKNFIAAVSGAFLLFFILALVNYMSFKRPLAWDLTYAGLNSLTEQTNKILASIDGEIEAKIFSTQENASALKGLLELYRLQKNDIHIEVIDPELRPELVEKYNVTKINTIILSKGDKKEAIMEASELNLTNALIKLTRLEAPTACFSQGHGEVQLDKKGDDGFSYLKGLLENSSYSLKTFLMAGVPEIPEECDSLIILGPQQGHSEKEVEMIEEFIQKGGGVLVGIAPNFNSDPHKEMRKMLKRWGVELRNDLVIDQAQHVSGSNGTVPMVQKYPPVHPIVKNFEGVVFFPLVSSLHESKEKDRTQNVDYFPLVRSTVAPQSWAESNVQQIIDGKIVFDEQEDTPGPITMAAAVAPKNREQGRIVVMGNANLLMNAYQNYGKNFMFFLNSLSWISKEERLIAFDTPQIEDVPVFISSPQLGIIFYFSVVFGPLLLLGAAFIVYRRRRLL